MITTIKPKPLLKGLLPIVHLLLFLAAFFGAKNANSVTLTAGQTNYITTSDITISTHGITSSLAGSSSSSNYITNLHNIITGSSGATSGAYGIRSTAIYNVIINAASGSILTTGSSGRGISIVGNSTSINYGSIVTLGTTSYGIYVNGNNSVLNNSGTISTSNSDAYGLYSSGDNNQINNSGAISTKVYGIYSDGNANQITNSGTITTSSGSSAHGIFISSGSASSATLNSHHVVTNSGTINSNGNGIYNKDAYSVITNNISGTITSGSSDSIYGIRNDGNNAIINNYGNVTSNKYAIYNEGNNVEINNYGNLNNGVRLGGATLNILNLSNISGQIDGDINSSKINIGNLSNPNLTFNQQSSITNINQININNGSNLNAFKEISSNQIIIDNNSKLKFNEGSSFTGNIKGLNNGAGSLEINASNIVINNAIGDSSHSLSAININLGSAMTNSGNIFANNVTIDGSLNFSGNNNLTIFGNVSTNGSGTINVGSQNQTISGNLTLNNGGALAVTLKNGGSGSLNVENIANIGSDAKLKILTSAHQGYIANNSKYVIISANSPSSINAINNSNIDVNNTNSNNYGFLQFSTSVDSDNLILNIHRVAASEITSNKNSQNIYQTLNEIGANASKKMSQFQQYLDASEVSAQSLDKNLDQLAPNPSKSSIATLNNLANSSITIFENRFKNYNLASDIVKVASNDNNLQNLGIGSANLKNSFWGQFFGSSLNQKATKNDQGYKSNGSGATFGIDQILENDAIFGGALTVSTAQIKDLNKSKKSSIRSYQISSYLSKNFEPYFVDGIIGFGFHQFASMRDIDAVNASAKANYSGTSYFLKTRGGFIHKLSDKFKLIPEISLGFLQNNISGYKENGADDLNLKVSASKSSSLEGRIGLGLNYDSDFYKNNEFQQISTNLKISYGQFLFNKNSKTTATFNDYQTSFSLESEHDKSSIRIGSEILAKLDDGVYWSADYSFDKKASSTSHLVLLQIKQKF